MTTPTEQELRQQLDEAAGKILALGEQILSLQRRQDEERSAFNSAYEQLEAMGVHPLFAPGEGARPVGSKPAEEKT